MEENREPRQKPKHEYGLGQSKGSVEITRKRLDCLPNNVRTTDVYVQIKMTTYYTPYHTTNSRWIKG